MILLRALNDLDIAANPLESGIASKKTIYDLTKAYYSNDKEYNSLSEKEKDLFIKEHMISYVHNNKAKLEKKYSRATLESRNDIKEFREIGALIYSNHANGKGTPLNINYGAFINFYKYLSTLQFHLVNGNNKITDWISFSRSFDKVKKYYDNQDDHKVAIVYYQDESFVDENGVMTIDLSSKEEIERLYFLCNKINNLDEKALDLLAEECRHDYDLFMKFINSSIQNTKINCRGFSYSTSSKEACTLKYIPKEYILDVFEQFQMDLFERRLYDPRALTIPRGEQKIYLQRLKRQLQELVYREKNPFLNYLFNELYINNKNINNLDSNHNKLIHGKEKILRIARAIPNINCK